VLGGGYIGLPRRAPHPAAAAQLARYLVSRPVQQRFARELGWFSARQDVALDDRGELLAGFVAMRDEVRPRPEGAHYPRVSRLWQESFRRVVFERADPAGVAQAAAHRLTEMR
jgi:ABC-type glycerol-3-phosphate transport system substrate-binding protein